jgi:hypothetical protein
VNFLVWFDMVRSKRIPADTDPFNAQPTGVPSVHVECPPGPERRRVRRPLAAAAWIAGCVALFAFYLRISLTAYMTSDGANNALQAWDMLHGHLLLHGWIIGDATYYTFELPVLAFTEIFFGLGDLASHAASALTYLIVTVSAVALALTGSRGLARVARCGVVVVVLAAVFHVGAYAASLLLGPPDHTGTSAFLLVSFLLIDRLPARWYTSPLLLAILCAGQVGDATVRYVAVPAVVVVCGYRVVAARSVRTGDAANALAAAVSVPLAYAVRAVMVHFGAYQMVAPKTAISPPGRWPHNAALAWDALRVLFGAEFGSGSSSLVRDAGYILGLACLLAAAAGLARVVWTWRTASRAEQLLCAAIAINLSAYVVSTIPVPGNPYEVVAVLPCGAVLAARACVPAHIGTLRAGLTVGLATIAALLPLTAAAVQPAAVVPTAPLSAWLSAHGLTYGLAGYWSSSATTLNTGNGVQLRAVAMRGRQVIRYDWETDTSWFDASRHDATFVIVDLVGHGLSPSAESYFGKPVKIEHVAHWAILIYHKNLLRQVAIAGT